MAIGELAILDGRYQLIRQMGGPPRTPLMVATDLKTGKVVCLRLQQFTTSIANLAAVPPLALDPVTAGDGPLLPFDFGVDEGMTYLVRDFVTGTPVEQLLGGPTQLPPVEIVSIFRRTGEALLAAMEQGFCHPGLALRHLLVTTDGALRVAGYDAVHRERRQPPGGESEMLVALVQQVLAGPRLDSLPPAARALLLRIQTWQATTVPPLETVVRQLRRAEDRMRGYSRGRAAVATGAHALGALIRRFRHLGPLLHPYVFVLALVVGMVLLAVHILSSPARPGRLYVYPVPTRASVADAQDFTVAPPQVIIVATAATAATTAIRNTSSAVTVVSTDRPVDITTVPAPSDASAVPQRQAAFQATAPSIPQRVVQQQVVATPFRPIQVRPRDQAVPAAQVTTRQAVMSAVRRTAGATATTVTGAMSIERAASTVQARITTSGAVSRSVVTASVITSHVTFVPATTDQAVVVTTVVQTAGSAATSARATTATAQTSDVSTRRTTASSAGAAASTVRSIATTESSRVAATVQSAVTAASTGGPAQR